MTSNEGSGGVRNLLSGHLFLTFVVGTTLLSAIVVLVAWLVEAQWVAALMAVGPALMTVILSLQYGDRKGLKEMLLSLTNGQVGGRWFGVSLLLFPLIEVCALLLYGLTGDSEIVFGVPRVVPVFAALPLMLCNELGWRGYAPKHLPVRYGVFVHSVIIGAAWLVSVSPVYLINTRDLIDIPLYELGMALIPMSILMFWLRANTRTLLMPAVFGASGIIVAALLPILPGDSAQGVTFWLVVGFLWLAAVTVVGYYGTDRLDGTIRELPPDELPVKWDKIMPREDEKSKGIFASRRNGRVPPPKKSFSGVGRKSRR